MECLLAVSNKYGSDEVLKNWVSSIYPLQSDYWTFRKTVSDMHRMKLYFTILYDKYSYNYFESIILIHLSSTNIFFSLLKIIHYFVSLSMHSTLSN